MNLVEVAADTVHRGTNDNMGKTKNKNHSEREHFLGIIRELKKEVRSLRKKLKETEKREHQYEDIVSDAIENGEIEFKTLDPICQHCFKGVVTETDLKFLIVKSCSLCNYEERIKT
jgi:hypothetical protein